MTVDTDLILRPSLEAKICLFCTKKKCQPHCERVTRMLKELREKENEKQVNSSDP